MFERCAASSPDVNKNALVFHLLYRDDNEDLCIIGAANATYHAHEAVNFRSMKFIGRRRQTQLPRKRENGKYVPKWEFCHAVWFQVRGHNNDMGGTSVLSGSWWTCALTAT